MNINKTIIARIEEYRATNKNPCKSYATEAAAEKATAQMAQDAANYFHKERGVEARPAQYVVIYNEAWGSLGWCGQHDRADSALIKHWRLHRLLHRLLRFLITLQ
jgi:hypothetical protein